MDREIIRPLAAWDEDDCCSRDLKPGAILYGCRILRNRTPGSEPYVMEFEFAGHRYCCPLFAFQPRTQALTRTLETTTANHAVAVGPHGLK